MSRYEKMEAAGKQVFEPPLTYTKEMSEYLSDLGFGLQYGNGLCPLTPSELSSWCEGTGLWLSSWQFETMLRASRAFVSEYNSSNDAKTPAPYITAESIIQGRKSVSDQMRTSLNAMVERQENNTIKKGGR